MASVSKAVGDGDAYATFLRVNGAVTGAGLRGQASMPVSGVVPEANFRAILESQAAVGPKSSGGILARAAQTARASLEPG